MSDPTKVSRRLVAVFAADVEGYSRLMGTDEVRTLKGLTERRAILDRIIGEHGGRIANTAGDLTAYDFYLRAVQQFYVATREGVAEALRLAHRALELDPGFGRAASGAGLCHMQNVLWGYANDP